MFVDFREKEKQRERERERENYRCEREILRSVPAICTPTADGTWNVGMCTDWDWHLQPFGYMR